MLDNEDNETINKYVKDLLRGRMQPSQVPKSLLPRIHISLDNAKSEAITRGSVDKVKQIHKLQSNFAQAEQGRRALASHSQLPPLKRKYSSCPHTNRELDSLLDSLANGEPFDHANTNIVPFLIPHCKNKINKLIEEQQFTIAQSYEDALIRLRAISNETHVENKKTNKRDVIQKQLESAEEALNEAKEDYESRLADFDTRADEQRELVLDQHEQQLSDFDAETEQGPSQQYYKMSQRYLNMREIQKNLVSSKRYDEAADMKEQADILEQQEKEMLMQKFMNERQILRDKNYKDYLLNLDCLDEQLKRKRVKLVQEFDLDLQNKQKNVDNIRKKLEEADEILKGVEEKSTTVRISSRTTARTKKAKSTLSGYSSALSSQRSAVPSKVSISTQTIKRFIAIGKNIEKAEI